MLIVGIVAAVVLLGLVGCFFLYRAFFSGKPTNGPVAKPTPIVEPTPDASTPAPTPFDNEPIVASSTPAAGELPAGAVQAPAKVSFDANNAENQDTRKAVLERVDLMPFPKATKDRLYKAVDTARSMGKIATIGFSTGQSAPSPAAVASLKQTFQRPDIQTLLTNPAAVVVVLGFADATGTAKKNKEASEQRAEKTLAALRDSLGLLNVMHSVGMGGSEFLGKGNLEKNRVAEIWIVIP
jgi:outer membrane protein OmpA-like peptidoglycan-associated protein